MIGWERRGPVGVVTIDRPERRNALDTAHCESLRAVLEEHRDVRALVVTGAGSAFCAGADLGSRFDEADAPEGGDAAAPEGGDPFHDVLQRLLEAVIDHPAPVIAAVNGPALGAGTQLASVCDLRVAAAVAVFGIPASRLGIMISAGSTERLVGLMGLAHTTEMLLTGRRYTADEAQRIGLAHRVVDDALGAALDLADDIAALAPLSVQGHKRALTLVARSARAGPDAHAEIGALIERCVSSDDLAEGIRAFAEKRPPEFRGS
jgi:enoyl-CoA hydratase